MTKLIYLCDIETGVFVGEALHPIDPVATEQAGEPVYAQLNALIATSRPCPPVPPGMQAVRTGEGWALRELPTPPEVAPEVPPPAEKSVLSDPLTIAQRIEVLMSAVTAHLDTMARASDYDDIKSAALRAGYAGPFQAEGIAYAKWMDACWARYYELLAQWERGELQEPSPAELVELLPIYESPPATVALHSEQVAS